MTSGFRARENALVRPSSCRQLQSAHIQQGFSLSRTNLERRKALKALFLRRPMAVLDMVSLRRESRESLPRAPRLEPGNAVRRTTRVKGLRENSSHDIKLSPANRCSRLNTSRSVRSRPHDRMPPRRPQGHRRGKYEQSSACWSRDQPAPTAQLDEHPSSAVVFSSSQTPRLPTPATAAPKHVHDGEDVRPNRRARPPPRNFDMFRMTFRLASTGIQYGAVVALTLVARLLSCGFSSVPEPWHTLVTEPEFSVREDLPEGCSGFGIVLLAR